MSDALSSQLNDVLSRNIVNFANNSCAHINTLLASVRTANLFFIVWHFYIVRRLSVRLPFDHFMHLAKPNVRQSREITLFNLLLWLFCLCFSGFLFHLLFFFLLCASLIALGAVSSDFCSFSMPTKRIIFVKSGLTVFLCKRMEITILHNLFSYTG